MQLRITTTSAEDHEAAKGVLHRAGFEIHESRPIAPTWALTFEADLADVEGLKPELRSVAATALINPL